MSDTTFVNNSTVIDATWLNDVNDTVYHGLAGAQTPADVRTALGLGTAAQLDVGTTANKVVQLDGTAKLPAVDGSQLTGITATVIDVTGATGTLPVDHGGTGATTAATARANLGSTTVGDAVFIAADAAAGRTALSAAGSGSVTSSGLTQATSKILGRTTAGTGAIEELTLSGVLDLVGSAAQGDILYRDAAGWARLAAGTSGYFLKTNGAGANPAWAAGGGGVGQQMVRLNTANGYGSTNTKIRRFTNTVTNTGSDITYADSATNGASFTINTSGVYAISYSDYFTTGGGRTGISVDSSQLTTNITAITASNVVAVGAYTTAANESSTVSATLYLSSGSVIRAHTNGEATGSGYAGITQFIIVRVA